MAELLMDDSLERIKQSAHGLQDIRVAIHFRLKGSQRFQRKTVL
jgi:hypothetical protein